MIYSDLGYVPFVVDLKYKLFDKNKKISYNRLYSICQRRNFSKKYYTLEFETLESDPRYYFRMFSIFRLHGINIESFDLKKFNETEDHLRMIYDVFDNDFKFILSLGEFKNTILSNKVMELYFNSKISFCTVMILFKVFNHKYFKHIELCMNGYKDELNSFNWKNRIKHIINF